MSKLLWLIAIALIFFGPIAGVYLGIHPGILPFLGIISSKRMTRERGML